MPVNPKIATIKIAAKQIGMDDATYRVMLKNLTGKTSSTELTQRQLDQVIDHLVKCGAKITRGSKRKGAPSTLDREPQLQKIEALLADMGLPWAYADKVAENITGGRSGGIQRLGWVKKPADLQKIIAALVYEQQKRHLLQQVNDLLESRGKTHADVLQKISPAYRDGWTRRSKVLESLLALIPTWWPING